MTAEEFYKKRGVGQGYALIKKEAIEFAEAYHQHEFDYGAKVLAQAVVNEAKAEQELTALRLENQESQRFKQIHYPTKYPKIMDNEKMKKSLDLMCYCLMDDSDIEGFVEEIMDTVIIPRDKQIKELKDALEDALTDVEMRCLSLGMDKTKYSTWIKANKALKE